MASTHHHSRPVREEVYRAQSQIHLGYCDPSWFLPTVTLLVDRLDQQGHLFTCAVSDEEEPVWDWNWTRSLLDSERALESQSALNAAPVAMKPHIFLFFFKFTNVYLP